MNRRFPLTWAVVVAAGSGARYGGPKQFEELAGRRVVDWSVSAARSVAAGVVVVLPEDAADVPVRPIVGADSVVTGGATRSASVRAGLAAVPRDAEIIVVHDAARPLARPALFEAVIAAVQAGADGAVPAVPVSDTVKRVVDGKVVDTVKRDGLVTVQTPQAFRAGALRAAHAAGRDATDDAAVVEEEGGTLVVVAGDAANVKITHAHDLAVAAALLAPAP